MKLLFWRKPYYQYPRLRAHKDFEPARIQQYTARRAVVPVMLEHYAKPLWAFLRDKRDPVPAVTAVVLIGMVAVIFVRWL